jgi:hypothetical protein
MNVQTKSFPVDFKPEFSTRFLHFYNLRLLDVLICCTRMQILHRVRIQRTNYLQNLLNFSKQITDESKTVYTVFIKSDDFITEKYGGYKQYKPSIVCIVGFIFCLIVLILRHFSNIAARRTQL